MRFLAAVLLFGSSAHALISPAWSANSNFKAALEGDSCYTVRDPAANGSTQKIVISACSDEKAQAWQTIVSDVFHRDLGDIEFQGPSGPVKPMPITGAAAQDRTASLTRIFELALGTNPHFSSVMQFDLHQCASCQANIVLEFKPDVIQVFMDDISDPWGQHNKTAQDHFAALLALQYGDLKVLTTTTKKP